MRVVRAADELDSAVALAKSEARSSFNDDRIYFERLLERPRHIEVQLLGDLHGTIVPFVERECSIQRRHQKLIEETPSPSVTPALRERLMAAAAAIGRASSYTSAGTIEFLVDAAGEFYFLEMNTRLQVEHPITEAVTGVDFVRAQIEIARGARLADMADLKVGTTTGHDDSYVVPTFRSANGHAIEVRVYAENPDEGFLPSPGRITHLRAPSGPGIRDDSGVFEGWTVPTAYDPLVSKVIAWAPDRSGAIARMDRALTEYDLRGISTTIAFCRDLVRSQAFAAAELRHDVCRSAARAERRAGATSDEMEEIAAIAAAMWAIVDRPSSIGRERPATGRSTTGNDRRWTMPDDGRSLWAQRARLDSLR